MIEILRLSRRYGDTLAVEDLSLRIETGEIFALLGPNGAGKSTTVKVLTGLIRPSTGLVRVAGFDVVENPIEVKSRTGYVPENAVLYESLTADEYLDLIGELRHMEKERLHARRDELFALFDLQSEDRKKLLSEFSKGMKQKVLLIAALAHNPEVLILDEPLSGLDASAALIFKEVLRRYAHEGNKTIFFSSHVLDVVERLCDRIAIISKGRLIAIGTAPELLEQAGEPSLERAFNRLTGGADIERSTEDVLRALQE
ncbi:MAG: ABC transporter ATP-binding protein [Bacteroidota bacterium]|nr:ABC transporter ATP-binding protein [Bacteroidota bacterium]MDP4233685.1 ABC transporter ATP-binding protein [Bacteroidota bacterium]MDP4241858.1 ABC transporter ATP-binding protein [Bacteroidota bacterium]MDP4288954.1 ABC transporter ATP-binding protein [Bacteroidota bacterium]